MGGDKPLPYDNYGNIDATHSNTAPSWTNHPHALRPLASQQVETNSATQFINVADEISSSRRTYNPSNSAAGDTEAIAAKGRLVLINGAVPTVQTQTGVYPSELFSHRDTTYNENTIAVSSDRGALEISGTNLMYEGTRVKTWIVGRDLNPGGRGDGAHYAQGMFSAGMVRPSPTTTPVYGFGNSINNSPPPPPNISRRVPPECLDLIMPQCLSVLCMATSVCTEIEWQTKPKECCEKASRLVAPNDPCNKCLNWDNWAKCMNKYCGGYLSLCCKVVEFSETRRRNIPVGHVTCTLPTPAGAKTQQWTCDPTSYYFGHSYEERTRKWSDFLRAPCGTPGYSIAPGEIRSLYTEYVVWTCCDVTEWDYEGGAVTQPCCEKDSHVLPKLYHQASC